MRVLNIDVGPGLLERWRSWFAPDPQPFLVDAALAETLGVERSAGPLPDELRDTYEVYAPARGSRDRLVRRGGVRRPAAPHPGHVGPDPDGVRTRARPQRAALARPVRRGGARAGRRSPVRLVAGTARRVRRSGPDGVHRGRPARQPTRRGRRGDLASSCRRAAGRTRPGWRLRRCEWTELFRHGDGCGGCRGCGGRLDAARAVRGVARGALRSPEATTRWPGRCWSGALPAGRSSTPR